ncbi:hypothetical protein [Paenibacillus antibioticophila]|uniref:hypothetical protein n=1 Tax=Paenibacillus antibioticophila TaxID=1274374 RepID=UPI001BB3DA89|nr:hypothetical protein [Paenibacillus antibioticophila]
MFGLQHLGNAANQQPHTALVVKTLTKASGFVRGPCSFPSSRGDTIPLSSMANKA